jgi:two-component system OmpR family sensor kinase
MTPQPPVDANSIEPPLAPWSGDVQFTDPNAWTPPPPEPGERLPAPPTPPTPHARRWRMVPRSLTGRLVTGVVSLVVVLVLATGIGTYYALRAFLADRLDQQVAQVADNNRNTLGPCMARGFLSCRLSATSDPAIETPLKEWLAVVSTDGVSAGRFMSQSHTVQQMSLPQAAITSILGHPTRTATIQTTDGASLRVAARSLPSPNGTFILLTGLSTDEVDRTLNRLLQLEAAIGASAVILALVATASGVRFSLRGLRRVTTTARDVTAELSPDGAGLDRRVPVTESGTEVGQLAESMNTLLAAVETQFAARLASEQRMRQFLADASHELRTPLTSIRGYAELARMQRQQGMSEPADNLARIESEGTRMSRLVDDLLTLARSDQGAALQHELVDVAELLDDAVTGARAAYPERRIDSQAPHGLAVIGDRDQLLRAVRNLVTNAAVHTRADGPISVSALRENGLVALRVVDAGPGLPPEEAAHVFERFWRADKARTRVRGGSGLGLAIVASVVAAHGGTVAFDSTVEGGSTVTVRLPPRTE